MECKLNKYEREEWLLDHAEDEIEELQHKLRLVAEYLYAESLINPVAGKARAMAFKYREDSINRKWR